MSYHTPQEVAELAAEAGERKAKLPPLTLAVLGFLGGAFIAIGFLLDIRVVGNVPKEWGSFASFLGAAVFPLGLILILIGGGELITGNLMAVPMAWFARRISFGRVLYNWVWITVTNFLGALFVAYFFGHIVGLTETGPFLAKTVAVTQAKLEEDFLQAFVSGIGCNWLVCMGVWLSYSAEHVSGKILGIWFPIMGFVAIGFQHIVANMFLIPAAIFAGQATWGQFFTNFVPVYLGNVVGGAIFVAGIYFLAYLRTNPKQE
ncbi:formate/nitrite transporter family protein [Tumebacillus sp. ITR2]|uniref:Formate/nitrite transporter family protein n=1 Tax=Tumebacillus amylolyticus TaxID=2801339 RepID=A0ABS1JDM2_9BACL|nr:formate/nitrite transporter family protein [Tumebacillus amylolyticus]MBL0388377.1 formate/nitrite transporter family protein [Tumebacillus amylolyticus]